MLSAVCASRFPSLGRLLLGLAAIALVAAPAFGEDPLSALRREVAGNRAQAPAVVVRTIRAQSPESAGPHWAARVIVAALQGLGPEGTAKQTTEIVYAAVRADPKHVLEIVHAAILSSPHEQAPHIAAAATAAVPNPWQKVTYRKDTTPLRNYRGEGDYKADFKSDCDQIGEEDEGAPLEKTLSLAEAIVSTICETCRGISPVAVLTAVDATLVGDPAWLLGALNNPVVLGPFGDGGIPNFGNEPFRTAVGGPTPPAPPPVSQ
jgi:hypothetical protein